MLPARATLSALDFSPDCDEVVSHCNLISDRERPAVILPARLTLREIGINRTVRSMSSSTFAARPGSQNKVALQFRNGDAAGQ